MCYLFYFDDIFVLRKTIDLRLYIKSNQLFSNYYQNHYSSMGVLRFIGQHPEEIRKLSKCWYKLNAISKREIRYGTFLKFGLRIKRLQTKLMRKMDVTFSHNKKKIFNVKYRWILKRFNIISIINKKFMQK